MFREDFVWGMASSAYQVEGKDPDDGAGKMIRKKAASLITQTPMCPATTCTVTRTTIS